MAHRGGVSDCCIPFISSGFVKDMTIEQRVWWTEGPNQAEEWNQKVYTTDWPKRSCRTHLSASQAGCCYIRYNKSVNIMWTMSMAQHLSSVSRAWSVTRGGGQRMGGLGFPIEGFRFFCFAEMVAAVNTLTIRAVMVKTAAVTMALEIFTSVWVPHALVRLTGSLKPAGLG